MAHQARTLRFAVTTSLLAVPVLAGCKPVHVNEGPQEPVHVNEGPQDPPPADDVTPDPAADGGAEAPDPNAAEGGAAEGGGEAPKVADAPTQPDGKPKVIVNPGPQREPAPKP